MDMSKRFETAANIAVLLGCLVAVGILVKDRILSPRQSLDANREATSAQAPPPNAGERPPTAPSMDPLDPGPEVATVERATVAPGDVAATVGSRAITVAGLTPLLGGRLFALESQQYGLRRAALDRAVGRVLLDQEARKRGVDLRELVRREIDSRVAVRSREELLSEYRRDSARFKGAAEAEALDRLAQEARQWDLSKRRAAFLQQLRSAAGVRIELQPPRVSFDARDATARGPSQAPVTIVEFSDFQCPGCRKGQEALRAVEARYEGQVRVIFKHFPLPMHPRAKKAAEAAECAGEQGRFWEMHDKLFGSSDLGDAALKRYAAEVGIGGERFARCLDGGTFAWKWQRDQRDGERVGVNATPTFFINGRLLMGAPTLPQVGAVIEEEVQAIPGNDGTTAGRETQQEKGGR
jgi:protein-disulfide isomerase